jgi:hypothetical protein
MPSKLLKKSQKPYNINSNMSQLDPLLLCLFCSLREPVLFLLARGSIELILSECPYIVLAEVSESKDSSPSWLMPGYHDVEQLGGVW